MPAASNGHVESSLAATYPLVTQDDLNPFHASHFSCSSLISVSANIGLAGQHYDYNGVVQCDDDGLGYYPDGVKRTLTDEQVAMFRHSEVREILKNRRPNSERINLSAAKPSEKSKTPSKRKRPSTGWQASEEGGVTYRRLAREQDEQKDVTIDLDYGKTDDASAFEADLARAEPKSKWPNLGAEKSRGLTP